MSRILIAEDDPSMCQFLGMALEKAGYEVEISNDGVEAMEIMNQRFINTQPPFDVLITDIVMPGMDGIELSRMAKEMFPDLHVLFITGFSASAQIEQGLRKSDVPVMAKPFHLNDLVKQVKDLLEN